MKPTMFTISNIHIDGEAPPVLQFEVLLRIVSDFAITIDATPIFSEREFPFIELASAVAEWLPAWDTRNFVFTSMDSATEGIVYFHKQSPNVWLVGSAVGTAGPPKTTTEEELVSGLRYLLQAAANNAAPFDTALAASFDTAMKSLSTHPSNANSN